MEDLEEDRRLGPQEAARVCDFLCMHGYPIYADWARSATDEMLLPFLGLMTRWLGGKEVLFEEFGAPTRPRGWPAPGKPLLLEEEETAQYIERALAVLHRFGMTGAMLWCFGDYDEKLWSKPPLDDAAHERFFGLWRSDHSAKPALRAIKGLAGAEAREWRDDFVWIDVTEDEFYLNPRGALRRLYQRFLRKHGEEV
jgi:endo-1,4-beta-mannosidase